MKSLFFRSVAFSLVAVVSAAEPRWLPSLYSDSFDDFSFGESERGGLIAWEPLNPGNWQLLEIPDRGEVAHLIGPGPERPGVRRPREYMLLRPGPWRDYSVLVEAATLEPESNAFRDICIIFGWQDDTHYYYAHLSSTTDRVHTVIMKVEGDTRQTIHEQESPVPPLGNEWQRFHLIHRQDGTIEVYLLEIVEPDSIDPNDPSTFPEITLVYSAQDTTYPHGRVGLGSFDDPALFDRFSIQGERLTGDLLPIEVPGFTAPNPGEDDIGVAGLQYRYKAEPGSITIEWSWIDWGELYGGASWFGGLAVRETDQSDAFPFFRSRFTDVDRYFLSIEVYEDVLP